LLLFSTFKGKTDRESIQLRLETNLFCPRFLVTKEAGSTLFRKELLDGQSPKTLSGVSPS
jgi:hypothetical protein